MNAPRDLVRHDRRGPGNALLYCFRDVSRWRVVWNWFWIALSKKVPWFGLKRVLLRRTGMRIGKRVAIGLDAQFDVLFPQHIHLEDDVIVGYRTTILCHEYMTSEYRVGPVVVGARAAIGANCTVLAGVTIAPDTQVSAMSLVNRNAQGFVGGVPARPLQRSR